VSSILTPCNRLWDRIIKPASVRKRLFHVVDAQQLMREAASIRSGDEIVC